MRALTTVLLAAFAALAAACAPAAPPQAEGPALWRLADADSEIWLFGTVHVLAPARRWRTAEFDAAFTAAEELVIETDASAAAQREAAALTARLGAMPPGERLSDLLSPEDSARLGALARELGLDFTALDARQPWLAALQLSFAHAVREGRSAEAGVETVLTAEARAQGKRMSFLETPEQQIRLLADLPREDQLTLLRAGLAQITEGSDALDRMDEAWARGDTGRLGALLDAQWREAGPGVHAALILARNRAWADAIEQRLAGGGRVFIAVGAAHLVGEGNVIALLRARGHAVEGP